MRRLLLSIPVLLIAAVAALLLALRSESFVLNAAHWAVRTFSDLKLELVNPSVDVYGGRLSADEVHLKPQAGGAPALLSVLSLAASTSDLMQGRGVSVSAGSVLIFVSDSDETSDPEPMQWLGYLRWLPAELSIDQVHLVTESQNTWIFPLKLLRGTRQQNRNYLLTAEADYEGEPLGIALDLLAVDKGRGVAAAETKIKLTAPLSGSEMTLAGTLEGSDEFFHYNLGLNASYTDISELLKGFEGGTDLDGALSLQGTMVGDTTGFVLSNATFVLDNAPEYSFEASGWLNYRVSGETGLALLANGEMSSVSYLVNWLDLDFGEFGTTSSSIELSGSLDKPVIESFHLKTENADGLSVGMSGRLNLYDAYGDDQAEENSLLVELHGPSLAVLQQWLGELPFDSGEWRATGRINGYREKLALQDIVVETGTRDTVELRATGAVGTILRPTGPDTKYTIDGIAFRVEAYTPDSAELAALMQLTGIPAYHEIQASLDINGTSEELHLANGQVVITASDLEATIGPLSAVIHPTAKLPLSKLAGQLLIELSDTSALSQYTPWPMPVLGPLKITARLAQEESRYQLLDVVAGFGEGNTKIETKGRVGNIAEISDVSLTTKIIGLDNRTILAAFIPSLGDGEFLGATGGFFRLTENKGVWALSGLELASGSHNSPLQLGVNGEIGDLGGSRSVDLEAKFRVDDRALIESLTGRPMEPIRGSLTLRSSPGKLLGTLTGHAGTTSIAGNASVAVSETGIQGVSLTLETPHLYLRDIGIRAAQNTEPEKAAPSSEPPETLPVLLRRIGPPYPVDVTLKLGGISGESSSIDSLDVRISGQDNRYTLERFSAKYKDAMTEIRGIVDLNPDPPALSLAAQSNGIPLGALLNDLGIKTNISGALTIQGGITVMGDTRESLIGSLNGSVAFALEDAVIEGAAYDLLATDLLAWIYSGALTEKSTHIDCTMAKFQLSQGVATTDSLYVESSRMLATGTAKFDLVKERMDLRITPMSKSRLLQVPSEVRLKGDMRNPKADVSAISAVADATTSALMLIPSLTLKLFGVESSRAGDNRPCQADLGS